MVSTPDCTMDDTDLLGLLDSLPSAFLNVVRGQQQARASLDTPSSVLEVARAIDAVEAGLAELHAARSTYSQALVDDDLVRVRAMRGSLTQYAGSVRGTGSRGDGGRATLLARFRADEAEKRVEMLTREFQSRITLVERLVARLPPVDSVAVAQAPVDPGVNAGAPPSSAPPVEGA